MTTWVTVRDLATLAGVKEATIHTYRHRGILPEPDRYFGSMPVWRRAVADKWVRERRPPGRPGLGRVPAQ